MIYTIGTSNRSIVEFTKELETRQITALLDVRSSPYSRYPWFNAPRLAHWADQAAIFYRHDGAVLGGRSPVPLDDPRYSEALESVISWASRERLALFCSEGEPEQCHRTWAIGASLLLNYDVAVTSIRRDGTEETVLASLARVSPQRFDEGIRTKFGHRLGCPSLF